MCRCAWEGFPGSRRATCRAGAENGPAHWLPTGEPGRHLLGQFRTKALRAGWVVVEIEVRKHDDDSSRVNVPPDFEPSSSSFHREHGGATSFVRPQLL